MSPILNDNYEAVNAVLDPCTITKDLTLASDHSWYVVSHPIHTPAWTWWICSHDENTLSLCAYINA